MSAQSYPGSSRKRKEEETLRRVTRVNKEKRRLCAELPGLTGKEKKTLRRVTRVNRVEGRLCAELPGLLIV